ncbi:MAG: hypothetical protein Q8N69_02760 [bacterium]|nr:hypothetical protein [bacterium]
MENEEVKDNTNKQTAKPENGSVKKGGGWFQKIPRDVLLSPSGLVLIMLAALGEIGDIIPLYPLDQLWEIFLEIIFNIFLVLITGISWKATMVPFIIERLDFLGIFPTTLIKLLGFF